MFYTTLVSLLKKQRFSFTLLGMLLFSIITTPLVGYQAYHTNYNAIIKHEHEHIIGLANTIHEIANSLPMGSNQDDLITALRKIWNNIGDNRYQASLSIIARNGRVILDTRSPEQHGKYVENSLLNTIPPVNLLSLVKNKQEWNGIYVTASKQKFLASFVYVPEHNVSIAVHVPHKNITQYINITSLPWIVSLSLLGMILFPFAIWLLHNAYITSQAELIDSNRALDSEIENRKVAEKSLDLYRLHLEALVQQRTNELKNTRDFALHADKIKSEFLANMSHELRTPLNSIICFTQMVSSGKAGEINDEQSHQLNMAYNSAKHLLTLINSILDISKIDAGKDIIHNDNIELKKLSNELIDLLSPLANSKNLELRLEGDDLFLYQIRTDVAKLKQTLINLLGNAIKFTSHGHVLIRFSLYGLKNLRIDVEDTGIGIDKDTIQLIFEPFTQADNTATRKHDGSGLGLAICRRYTELLGGRLDVDSTPGRGSTFSIFLPDVFIMQEPLKIDSHH